MSSESTGHGGSCGVLVTTLEFVPSFWGPLHLAQEPEIEWINNYPAAIARAKATGKPLFLEFRCVP